MLLSHTYKFIYIKTHKTASSSLQTFLAPFCKDGIVDPKKYEHRIASSAKTLVGDEIWNSYTKICPIRNPWDKMVSRYHWRKRYRGPFYALKRILKGLHPVQEERRFDFTEWVKFKGPDNIDKKTMYIDGQIPDYHFIRFEHLREDLENLCENLQIPYDPKKIPNEKSGYRKDGAYRKYYTPETKAIIEQAYMEEIQKFGYQF